jgi:hypothetical protein
MSIVGKLIGALDARRLITKGPVPPRLIVSGRGASKSSTLRSCGSAINGEACVAKLLPMECFGATTIFARSADLNRDGCRFAAREKKSHALCQKSDQSVNSTLIVGIV